MTSAVEEVTPVTPLSSPKPVSHAPSFIKTGSATSSSQFIIGPKLSIKLDEKNFLIWNQQVEGVVATHRLHRLLVNTQIPNQFDSLEDRAIGKVSDAYDQWFVQDQALFTWSLSTIFDVMLPRVLDCHHAYQVWDTIHRHFTAHLRAKTRQLRAELKSTKKGNRSINEFISRVRAIASSLAASGDRISDRDLVDVVLDGLPEEYNSLILFAFAKPDTLDLMELESLLLVQEAQLDKFRQELATPFVSANVVHTDARGGHAGGRFGGR